MRLNIRKVWSPEERVKLAEEQIRASIHSSEVGQLRQFLKREVLVGVTARDEWAIVQAIYWWVRNNLDYYPDPTGLDLYPTAKAILAQGIGDCNNHTILLGSFLGSIGFPLGVRVIRDQSRGFHIYPLVGLPAFDPVEWIPLDTAWDGIEGPGDEYPRKWTTYRRDWRLELE